MLYREEIEHWSLLGRCSLTKEQVIKVPRLDGDKDPRQANTGERLTKLADHKTK